MEQLGAGLRGARGRGQDHLRLGRRGRGPLVRLVAEVSQRAGRYASKYDNHQYSRSDDDDFDWTITDQPTPTLNTGPSAAWAGSKEGPLLTESFKY